jgi:hypothetical protein
MSRDFFAAVLNQRRSYRFSKATDYSVFKFRLQGSINASTAHQGLRAFQAKDSPQQWITAARAERESLPFIDERVPAAASPLTLG